MKNSVAWPDQRFEELIANLLRTGVLLSATVVFLGAILYLVRHGFEPADYRVFHGEPSQLRSPHAILAYAFHLRGLIQLGLLLLIATPVARVTFSVFGFARERDRMYVGFTLVVLIVLLYSLFGSSL